jgi:hypothetical protein
MSMRLALKRSIRPDSDDSGSDDERPKAPVVKKPAASRRASTTKKPAKRRKVRLYFQVISSKEQVAYVTFSCHGKILSQLVCCSRAQACTRCASSRSAVILSLLHISVLTQTGTRRLSLTLCYSLLQVRSESDDARARDSGTSSDSDDEAPAAAPARRGSQQQLKGGKRGASSGGGRGSSSRMSDNSESSEDIDEYDDDYYKDSEDKKTLMALPEVSSC